MFHATRKYQFTLGIFALIAVGIIAPSILRAAGQAGPYKDQRVEAAKLLARTMNNPEFRMKGFRGGAWLGNGDYYLAIENSKDTPGGTDIVRYATSTGARDIYHCRVENDSGRRENSVECGELQIFGRWQTRPDFYELKDGVAPEHARRLLVAGFGGRKFKENRRRRS